MKDLPILPNKEQPIMQWTTRYYRLVMPVAGMLAVGTVLAGTAAVATAKPDEGTENRAKSAKGTRVSSNMDVDGPVTKAGSFEKGPARIREQSERIHRRMEGQIKRMIEEAFAEFGDDSLKTPKWFYTPKSHFPHNEFGPPKGFFGMPKLENLKPGWYLHSSRYSMDRSWSQAGGAFHFNQRIGGLNIDLRGTVSDHDVDIQTIQIETRPGKTLSFKHLEDVPTQYRDEVKSAIKDARQYIE